MENHRSQPNKSVKWNTITSDIWKNSNYDNKKLDIIAMNNDDGICQISFYP